MRRKEGRRKEEGRKGKCHGRKEREMSRKEGRRDRRTEGRKEEG